LATNLMLAGLFFSHFLAF